MIDICDNVRLVYKLIQKATGGLGGHGSATRAYGDLTVGSMQEMVNLMKEHTDLGPLSKFIDVGSGIGKPNLHVMQDPGVQFSYGIEIERCRWVLSLASLNSVLQECRSNRTLGYKCMIDYGDIESAETFDPFTHVYMLSIGFPPKLWVHLVEMFNKSQSRYLICFHRPQKIIGEFGFNVELIAKAPMSLHRSGEVHSGYIYRRIGGGECEAPSNGKVVCDPVYREAYNLVVNSDRERLCETVAQRANKEVLGCEGIVTRTVARKLNCSTQHVIH